MLKFSAWASVSISKCGLRDRVRRIPTPVSRIDISTRFIDGQYCAQYWTVSDWLCSTAFLSISRSEKLSVSTRSPVSCWVRIFASDWQCLSIISPTVIPASAASLLSCWTSLTVIGKYLVLPRASPGALPKFKRKARKKPMCPAYPCFS